MQTNHQYGLNQLLCLILNLYRGNFISPIKLGISPNQKGNPIKGIKSGKVLLKKYGTDFRTLFDEVDA